MPPLLTEAEASVSSTNQTKRAAGSPKSVAARRRRAGSPAMPSLEDDEDAKAVKQDAGDIPPIVQKVCSIAQPTHHDNA